MSTINWIPFFKLHNFGIEGEYLNNNLDYHILLNSKLFNLYNKKYILSNIHIHLNCENLIMGSEHAVEFERFDGEV